jgi:hypothetical protein
MNPPLAARLTRWWTRTYTAGLPNAIRDARRAEVESDLWESLADPAAARQILPRLVLGAVDDLAWSVTCMDQTTRSTTWWSVGSLATASVMWLWLAHAPDGEGIRDSRWVWPLATTIHVLGLVAFIGLRMVVDLRLMGQALGTVQVSGLVARLTPWTLAAGAVTLGSGLALYMAEPARFLADPLFQIKIAALAAALLNAWYFHAVTFRSVRDWDLSATPLAARLSAYVSLGIWATVIVVSQLMPYDLVR